ncbi:hypothetical protein AYX14_01664 [Cryptococcus neoformans]|nr:hypothetical protein AYX14_01664 [Cryptococcus neoformans var. grubii]
MPHVAAPSRQALEQERLHRHAQQPGSSLSPAPRLSPLRLYLLGYNILSALLWGHLLVLTLSFLLAPSRPPWHQLADRLSGSYGYHSLGWCTKWTQTLAVLVASRLWTVWGVVEAAPEITHGHPLFTTMLLAWSLTEVIRYSFYALSLLSVPAPFLNYLRYTTFIPLYPLGASSEAFLSFATLPALAPVVSRAVTNVMAQAPRDIMKTKVGREVLWWSAKHGGGTAGAQKEWGWIEIVRAGLFLLWWPALYVLYTYMLKQRRKVLGKGKTVGGVSKAQ